MSTFMRAATVLALMALSLTALADDAYYRVPLQDLELTEGTLPSVVTGPHAYLWARQQPWTMKPYAVLDGEGATYMGLVGERPGGFGWFPPGEWLVRGVLAVRAPEGEDVTGRLFLPNAKMTGMEAVSFRIPAARASGEAHRFFHQARREHYEMLLRHGLPGAAWFRHQFREAQRAEDAVAEPAEAAPEAAEPDLDALIREQRRTGELADTYALFTGGRAMSENLQLERVLPAVEAGEPAVEVASLTGITVNEMDWTDLVRDLKPQPDPLAAKIPFDQHAVFFPTFDDAMQVADEVTRFGTPVLHLAEPRSEDAGTLARYERQMGLTRDALTRLLGPHLVKSVALTGSDPYYRTGTDVAVLFETPDPSTLETLLWTRILAAGQEMAQVEPVEDEIDGLAFRGRRTPDRTLSAFIAVLDDAVVVANSTYQIRRLAGVKAGNTMPLASLPEYVFFRDRYPRGNAGETALVMLSDATIRRWCGPRWRIATSRRTRDIAAVADMQARHLDALARDQVEPGPIYTDPPLASGGALALGPGGVRSSVHGNLGYMTPLAEVPIDRVSQAEGEAYEQWRDSYQRNWRWSFDPIALRLGIHQNRLSADLTVMPLIWGTEYRGLIGLTSGVSVDPDGGDRHGAVAHFVMAINKNAEQFQQGTNILAAMTQGLTMGWFGDLVEIYADDGPEWAELAQAQEQDKGRDPPVPELFRLPVAVRIGVSNSLQLTAFLASTRAFIEQTAPGMTKWVSLEHNGQPYVRITPSDMAKGSVPEPGMLDEFAVFYAPAADSLTIALREEVIQRALDRQMVRQAAREQGKPLKTPGLPWLGSSLGLQVDRTIIEVVAALSAGSYETAMRLRSWGNLPVLNEWKRRYPDQDPVGLHEKVWQVRLVCPGGGEYVWNEAFQTMESTVYGHPGAPGSGPATPPVLSSFEGGSFGLTFEDQGLRAGVVLAR